MRELQIVMLESLFLKVFTFQFYPFILLSAKGTAFILGNIDGEEIPLFLLGLLGFTISLHEFWNYKPFHTQLLVNLSDREAIDNLIYHSILKIATIFILFKMCRKSLYIGQIQKVY